MADLQQRIDELRYQIQSFSDGEDISALERAARDLLSDAKNTPHEAAAQTLFANVAQLSNPASPTAATVRGLARRARIRIEVAGSEEDIDEAIDILAEALSLDPKSNETADLLQQAAAHNEQAAQRVSDLFNRYQIQRSAPTPAAPVSAPPPRYPTSSGYKPPETELEERPEPEYRQRRTRPGYGGMDVDEALSQLTEAYYAGDYQQTIEIANRLLTQQPGNPTALEYRQKAEDNLIRGIVPDHRIPFDARVAYNRANSLVRAGSYEEAERLYREARDLAERSGILNWKDAEQALLDIQDLALARELIQEGDRLVAVDNWNEALRKYEGALRVVPNDPQAEDRVDMVRRVQQDADQAMVQLNTLGGSLQEQVAQVTNIRAILARVRQLLPNSQRLAQFQKDADNRLIGIKTQLNDHAQAALARSSSAVSLEEKLLLTNEALKLMELAVELDPGDTSLSERMMEARAASGDMARARQVIERAAALIAQNFDNELTQARTMLAGLRDHAQDDRYRMVVSDLLGRYMERAETALQDGDVGEAQSWLDTLREEPFRILGRRAEIQRLESAIRARRSRGRYARLGILGGIIGIIALILFFSRDSWQPALFPPNTVTPTHTFTPSETYTPSATFTPSETYTPSATFTATITPTETPTGTWTWTPSPTWTPSWTVTPSLTPTHTLTSTHTATITPTFTPSMTPTETATPTITLTPPELCRVFVSGTNQIRLRSRPTTSATQLIWLNPGTSMAVVSQQREEGRENDPGAPVWYNVRLRVDNVPIEGWVRFDTVTPTSECPPLP